MRLLINESDPLILLILSVAVEAAAAAVASGAAAAAICVSTGLCNESADDGEAEGAAENDGQCPLPNKKSKRRKNRIPDRGEPGTTTENEPGTTKKHYGPDGWVEKEWNKGHGPSAPPEEQGDHVHDHIPNPYHPDGRPDRQPGRTPQPGEFD